METFIEKFRNSYHLSENDTQTLLSYMEEIRFKKKEVIVHEGSKNGNLYLIPIKHKADENEFHRLDFLY